MLDGLVKAGILMDDSFFNIQLLLEGEWDKDRPRTVMEIREERK